jgi:hypothetical protein
MRSAFAAAAFGGVVAELFPHIYYLAKALKQQCLRRVRNSPTVLVESDALKNPLLRHVWRQRIPR